MGCKAILYAQNQNSAIYGINATIPVGDTVRRFGQCVKVDGNGVRISGRGYYEVLVTATVAPVAAGTVSVQLQKDGVPVPGAFASAAASAGETVNLAVPCVVREQCCDSSSLLTLVLLGAQSTLYGCSTVVERM